MLVTLVVQLNTVFLLCSRRTYFCFLLDNDLFMLPDGERQLLQADQLHGDLVTVVLSAPEYI